MNYQMIIQILGHVITLEGAFLALPCITALIYRETEGFAYLATALLCVLIGRLIVHKKPRSRSFYAREGFSAVALSWIVLSLFGAIPFTLSGDIPSYIDALFEIISGMTTTGASILDDVEALSHTSLLWRSFSHWFGGMGVLVFILALIPMTGGRSIHLLRAESPGPSVEKLVPKMKQSSIYLYGIYLFLTILQIIFLLLGGMPVFDSINISLATAGTGGFAVLNSSMADYSPYIQYVTSIFMILFGINFNVFFLLLMRRIKTALSFEELRHYVLIIALAVLGITCNIRQLYPTLEESFRHSLFQVASLITTTGFATTDYDLWPSFSKTILLLIMFVGACAGSTGGGIKVSRVMLAVKSLRAELTHFTHPNSVQTIKYNNNTIPKEMIHSVFVFFVTYIFVFATSQLLLSLNGFDFLTNFSAVSAALNNIGPGLSGVGPTCNYGSFSVFSKFVLMFDMLAGRLELFPLLLICTPSFWNSRKNSLIHKNFRRT